MKRKYNLEYAVTQQNVENVKCCEYFPDALYTFKGRTYVNE